MLQASAAWAWSTCGSSNCARAEVGCARFRSGCQPASVRCDEFGNRANAGARNWWVRPFTLVCGNEEGPAQRW